MAQQLVAHPGVKTYTCSGSTTELYAPTAFSEASLRTAVPANLALEFVYVLGLAFPLFSAPFVIVSSIILVAFLVVL